MDRDLIVQLHSTFEQLVKVHEHTGTEFWLARELQRILGYTAWRNFEQVIQKAITACRTAGYDPADHLVEIGKMVPLGSGAEREVADWALTRYACYLVAQNGESFAFIRSKGDQALFGGKTTGDMKDRLGVPTGRALADFLPTITIKAKDFANEITNFSVKRDDLKSEPAISAEHVKNNRDVRRVLTNRGIVPESLPPAEDIKKVARRLTAEEVKLLRQPKALAPGKEVLDE